MREPRILQEVVDESIKDNTTYCCIDITDSYMEIKSRVEYLERENKELKLETKLKNQ